MLIPDMPVLVCSNCKKKYLSDYAKTFLQYVMTKSAETGAIRFTARMKNGSKYRYDICKELNFKYDANDCKFIPRLQNPMAKEGFFTPIFFNRKVLHKYISFDEYAVDMSGNTYGVIYFPNESHLVFGINRNNKMFCWLGDIEEIPENERVYLLSENIESDHDIASEFYAGQIEVEFAEPSNEIKLLNERMFFAQSWKNRYLSQIFQKSESISVTQTRLVRPVNWNQNTVMPIFNELNKLCVESLCRDAIMGAIRKEKPNFSAKRIGAMKLTEKLIETTYPEFDAKEIMKPFFVLYDFRIVLEHSHTEEATRRTLDSCYERLKILKDNRNFEKLYDQLLENLTESYSKLKVIFQ